MTRSKLIPVDVFKEIPICHVCGHGELHTSHGMMLSSDPPQYEASCSACGVRVYLRDIYPKIIYKEKHND